MKKRFLAVLSSLFLVLVGIGCAPAQVPPPSPQPSTSLTCSAPSGFTAGSGNGFIFARAVCSSTTSCPANTAGNTTFTQLNTTPATSCAFTDTAPPTGVLVIYTASTVQAGLTGQPSAPSNSGVPLAIPTYPGTPSGLSGTTSAALAPPILPNAVPEPELSKNIAAPLGLQAKLILPHK